MAKLIRSVPCLNVITDKDTTSASYIHVVEVINILEGGLFPPILIGTLWQRTRRGDKITLRVRIFTPGGDVHTAKEISVEFGEFERYRINFRLPSFPVRESGDYTITIEHKGREKWVKDDEIVLPVSIESESRDQSA